MDCRACCWRSQEATRVVCRRGRVVRAVLESFCLLLLALQKNRTPSLAYSEALESSAASSASEVAVLRYPSKLPGIRYLPRLIADNVVEYPLRGLCSRLWIVMFSWSAFRDSSCSSGTQVPGGHTDRRPDRVYPQRRAPGYLNKGVLHHLVWGRSPGDMAFLVRVDLIRLLVREGGKVQAGAAVSLCWLFCCNEDPLRVKTV